MSSIVLSEIHAAYLLLFGATLFFVEGVYYLMRDRYDGPGTANRRMRLIAAGKDREAVLARLRRADLDAGSTVIARLLPGLPRLIREAGLTITPLRLVLVGAGFALMIAASIVIATPLPPELALVFGLVPGAVAPALWLKRRRAKRMEEFGQQLPEALEMMVRSLRAGHPIPSALSMVASELNDPAGSEFGIVVDEMTYGFDLGTALRNMIGRMPHQDLGFFVVAVQIQSQTGGNLAEILDNLARVIRDRATMKMKIKTITAQGRSSAWVVALTPLLTLAAVNFLAPEYFREVMHDPIFQPAAITAVLLWGGGLYVVYRLLQFRI